ncbi:MAG: radical SAM protein [Thermodesulfobacteriota bacterium]
MSNRRPGIAFLVPKTNRIARRPALIKLWRESVRFRESSFFFPLPNLALLTLAGLVDNTFELEYHDENIDKIELGDNCQIAAITSMTCQANRAYRLASMYRKKGLHVVLGGMHPTVIPEEAMNHADTVIAGEAEELWPAFLKDYKAGRPKKLYQSSKKSPYNLKKAPVPRYDLIRPQDYRAMPVQVGRGCPLGCEFCSVEVVHGRKYRHKEIEQVLDEIKVIKKVWQTRRPRIFFTDDNLHLHREVTSRLLEKLIPLKINWMAQMDISVGRDQELLSLMAKSGCSQLLIGFESLNRANLDSVQPNGVKQKHLAEYGKLIKNIQSYGIRVLGMFIIGLDQDRQDVFQQLRDFIFDNDLHDAQITIQTPLPGTRLYSRMQKEGRLLEPVDWQRCNFFYVNFLPLRHTARQLVRGQSWLYQQIHCDEAVARRQKYWLDHYRNRIKS